MASSDAGLVGALSRPACLARLSAVKLSSSSAVVAPSAAYSRCDGAVGSAGLPVTATALLMTDLCRGSGASMAHPGRFQQILLLSAGRTDAESCAVLTAN